MDHTHTGYATITALSDVEAEITSMRTEVDNMTSEVTDIVNTSLENKADKSEIQGMVTSNTIIRIEVVAQLPEKEEDNVLYIVMA